MNRLKYRIIGKLLLHAALVAGSALFAAPFIWLVSTSVKSADELFPPRWMPPLPDLVSRSPYLGLRDNELPVRPSGVEEELWEERRDKVAATLSARIQEMGPQLPDFFQPYLGHPLFAESLFAVMLRRTPDPVFNGPEAECLAWFRERVTPREAIEVFENTYRRMALTEAAFVSWDMEQVEPLAAEDIRWTVLEGDVEVVPRLAHFDRKSQELHYRFENTPRFRVQAEFPVDWTADRLKKFRIGHRADRSWHTVWATLELGGHRFEASEPGYVGTDRWQDFTWQMASPEDRSVMVKTWLVMHDAGDATFNQPGMARLTLEYRQARGIWPLINKFSANYLEVLRRVPLGRYVRNSVYLVIMNIVGQLFGASLVAYAFARLQWPGRELCFLLVLATLMIPPQVTLIPVFLIFKELGWYNTLKPLWVPAFAGSAFFIFLLRQFMRTIPADLEDSAKIDGCSYFGIYWRIILPLIKPALATIAIFTFMWVWNDFMGPLIFVTNQELYPLSLGLFSLHAVLILQSQHQIMMAASVLMTLPVILLFFAAQRQFIQGITLTGMKG